MNFRLAQENDLEQLKAVFRKIIEKMNAENGRIWDDTYPCEFFAEDIKNRRLYVLTQDDIILSAFALWELAPDDERNELCWASDPAKALYFGRFGVNVDCRKSGVGSVMMSNAIATAMDKGAECLRVFVAEKNKPAMSFYLKNGFEKTEVVYDEALDEDFVLRQFGFEKKLV
ncbi:MAG: GNAT family N-acetyltransferase [Eubacterium sp.]|nr:GNAT family N-acetyltransferase [Eubacterium sp.]